MTSIPNNSPKGNKKSVLPSQSNITHPTSETTWHHNGHATSLEGKFEKYIAQPRTIVSMALKGVKTDVFYAFARIIDVPDKLLADLINTSSKTISNYRETNKALEPVKGEHLLKLIALFRKGEEVLGNLNEFHGWLTKPQAGQIVPIAYLVTPGGIDLVAEELDRITHGYAI
ncbi:uncharacterized protein DUF2384 [Chitinophaga skermanii]|uniref:Uncharacterized protein DUF2384 n=1 Tax=Chitinophaga skermanii TaxID=331697 RepID=A0A327Q3W2_9BACT|nr:antitoxin Xre/MbcA/ParS toxin-binding domain-containing protein [Chitinophaga skermanii]RAI98693.1 uncharacterized protein DUF2384 [Chitinophaga skermanii]